MSKVILYGHLIVDRIFIDFKQTSSVGGIANVWNGLIQLDQTIDIDIQPCALGEAVVIVSPESNKRIGRANFNLKTRKPKVSTAAWHHIAYLNQLEDLSFLEQINTGVISADLSKESPEKVLNYTSKVDYLFLSKEDLFIDIKELGQLTKGWVIAHDPEGSVCSNGKEVVTHLIPSTLILKNINVLGAGDMFAASFISSTLKGLDFSSALKQSHESTTQLLKNNCI